MKIFHICTISNDLQQYTEMKISFISAGFELEKCRYSLFDNSEKNQFDPYQTFNLIKSETIEPYIILCHQDVLTDRGDNFDRLVNLLKELDELDPCWAIAGNAGVNRNHEIVANITDPCNTPKWSGNLPHPVYSLDENFLIVKTAANISTSKEIKGFHFYGTDLCLSAHINKQSCYVINFHLTHLSGGTASNDFWKVQSEFYQNWCKHFTLFYIRTTMGVEMCLSKYRIVRYIGSRQKVMSLIFNRYSKREYEF
jgi:hypothetical protein